MNEIIAYYRLADADTIAGLRGCYRDPRRVLMAIAEHTYIYTHQRLPEWAVIVERFEIVDDGYLFVHRDFKALH